LTDKVQAAIAEQPRLKLVINGSFGDNNFTGQNVTGRVVENYKITDGSSELDKGYIAYQKNLGAETFHFRFGIGDTPLCDVGIGGSGSVMLCLAGNVEIAPTIGHRMWNNIALGFHYPGGFG